MLKETHPHLTSEPNATSRLSAERSQPRCCIRRPAPPGAPWLLLRHWLNRWLNYLLNNWPNLVSDQIPLQMPNQIPNQIPHQYQRLSTGEIVTTHGPGQVLLGAIPRHAVGFPSRGHQARCWLPLISPSWRIREGLNFSGPSCRFAVPLMSRDVAVQGRFSAAATAGPPVGR